MLHPMYNHNGYRHDLALLKMDAPVNTSIYVPICLPALNTTYIGTEVWVLGWGHTQENGELSDTLQELKMTVAEDKVCSHFPGEELCAGGIRGKDSCQGDSGGPLQSYNNVTGTWSLAGITSRGQGCAREGLYGVYTKIPREYKFEIDNEHIYLAHQTT